MRRRAYLAGLGTAGLAATAGCIGGLPVVGSLTSGCGPAEDRIEAVKGNPAFGETVTVRGKLDYALVVDDAGMLAFRLDGETGTIGVFLAEPPAKNLDFGDCLTVRGTLRPGGGHADAEGPVLEDAALV